MCYLFTKFSYCMYLYIKKAAGVIILKLFLSLAHFEYFFASKTAQFLHIFRVLVYDFWFFIFANRTIPTVRWHFLYFFSALNRKFWKMITLIIVAQKLSSIFFPVAMYHFFPRCYFASPFCCYPSELGPRRKRVLVHHSQDFIHTNCKTRVLVLFPTRRFHDPTRPDDPPKKNVPHLSGGVGGTNFTISQLIVQRISRKKSNQKVNEFVFQCFFFARPTLK